MNQVFLIALLGVALPMSAWGSSTQMAFANAGGRIARGNGGIILSVLSSSLSGITASGSALASGKLGYVSFSTGPLTSGSLGRSAVFAAGGSFTVIGNGSQGLPSGTLFQGSFIAPVSWVDTYNPHGNGDRGAWTYTLAGTVTGTMWNGAHALGQTVQSTFDVPQGRQFSYGLRLNYGTTSVTVPEPATLSLLGTAVFALAGCLRSKFSA